MGPPPPPLPFPSAVDTQRPASSRRAPLCSYKTQRRLSITREVRIGTAIGESEEKKEMEADGIGVGGGERKRQRG
jgi:hypothetical protein